MIRLVYIAAALFALPMVSYRQSSVPQENHPPVVKLLMPGNSAVLNAATPVSYQISVADKEDGDSRFDEINAKEVLLEVKFLRGKAEAAVQGKAGAAVQGKPGPAAQKVQDDPPGLAVMMRSNCFNCHKFNSKSIGPSFFEISKRYPALASNSDTLIRRVKEGSSGVWGKEKMPSHPELSAAEIINAIQWILKNAASQDVSYYNGTAGILQFPRAGAYSLTASYTDHGGKDVPGKRLRGVDAVVVRVK